MQIKQLLTQATQQLAAADIPSARLDALVLLCDALEQEKSWILAHDEQEIDDKTLAELEAKVAKRANRYPLAYIRGKQEFYGRDFAVTEAALIPRPETETLIDEFLALHPLPTDRIIDVGTGSGAIAITIARELASSIESQNSEAGGDPLARVSQRPQLARTMGAKAGGAGPTDLIAIEAIDISPEALKIAQQNAQNLGAKVDFYQSNLLENAKNTYDFILANLPYVDEDWERSPETAYEPKLALFATENGLELIYKLLRQARKKLQPNGHILLEADPRQHAAIIEAAEHLGLTKTTEKDFIIVLRLT